MPASALWSPPFTDSSTHESAKEESGEGDASFEEFKRMSGAPWIAVLSESVRRDTYMYSAILLSARLITDSLARHEDDVSSHKALPHREDVVDGSVNHSGEERLDQ